MKKIMCPSERVLAQLSCEQTDKIPFTVYESLISESHKNALYGQGLCIVDRVCSYSINYSIKINEICEKIDECTTKITKVYHTDKGDLTSVVMSKPGTSWTVEHLFKSADDYAKLVSLVLSMSVTPIYDGILALKKNLDKSCHIIRDQIPLEPMQKIILEFMGTEMFCYEVMDNFEEIERLYKVIREFNRSTYKVVANSPLDICNYGGNVMPSVTGIVMFKDYYIPNYLEAAETVHKTGKKMGSHFDSDNTVILSELQNTGLDYIEAYDLGMNKSIDEYSKFCKKPLWLNFPSAWQMHDLNSIYNETKSIILSRNKINGLIVGITEDVDERRILENCKTILKAINS